MGKSEISVQCQSATLFGQEEQKAAFIFFPSRTGLFHVQSDDAYLAMTHKKKSSLSNRNIKVGLPTAIKNKRRRRRTETLSTSQHVVPFTTTKERILLTFSGISKQSILKMFSVTKIIIECLVKVYLILQVPSLVILKTKCL